MLFVYSLLSILFLYMSYRKDKVSPLTVFLGVWTGICLMYGIRLYGINSVSCYTELIIILALICFISGYLFGNIIKINTQNDNVEDLLLQELKNKYMYNAIKVVAILDFMYMMPRYISKIVPVLQSGWSLSAMKALLGEGSDILTLYVFDPFNFFLVALTAYLIIYNRKEKFLIFMGILLNMTSFLATGSRARVIFFALSFFVMAFTENSAHFTIIKRKIGKTVLFLGAFVIVVSGYGLSLFRQIYFYFCGCVPLLDRIVTHSDPHFIKGMTYGTLSLNGFLRIIPNFVENVIDSSIKIQPFEIAEKYIEYFEYAVEIAPGEISNSFYSFIGNFYLDFGILGVVLMSFIYGLVICLIYRKNKDKRNPKSKMLLSFIYYAMFFSMVRCSWMNIRFAIGFLLIFIFSTFSNSSLRVKKRRRWVI